MNGRAAPLQCSCMENPKDRGAWWAAVHGITKSGTRTHALEVMEQGWPGVALGQEGRGG